MENLIGEVKLVDQGKVLFENPEMETLMTILSVLI